MGELSSPPHEHLWDRYAAMAAGLHKGRVEGYPRLVEAAKLDEDVAERRTFIMGAIAEIWRAAWVCTLPDPMLTSGVDRCDIIEELLRARDITDRRLKADPSNGGASYQRECIDGMIDWYTRFSDGPLFCVRITLQLRAMNAAEQRKAAA